MANIPKSFRTGGRSSEVKGKYYTTYVLNEKHPGMPDIGAVEKFRKNIAEATHEANRQIAVAVNSNTLPAYIARKTGKGARPENMPFNIIKPSSKKTTMSFSHHFDKKQFVGFVENITHDLKQLASNQMKGEFQRATETTKTQIKNGTRRFKSQYFSNEKADGDIYHTVADSLQVQIKDQDVTKNQYISGVGGSYDITDSDFNPTGVKGSRGGNLAQMTERGTMPKKLRGQGNPFGGTARIKNRLKTR